MFTQKIFSTRFTDIFGKLEKLTAFAKLLYCSLSLRIFVTRVKKTNSLNFIDVLGPLAQSAERGADNAKVR